MNWGFMGFGGIAPKFLKSLHAIPDQKIVAVATKSGKENAAYKCPGAVLYDDYLSLVTDAKVEIVYISTTHNFHLDQVIMCLENGKHVICEKPMSLTKEDALRIANFPRKTFLMEGMWTRFLPAYDKMKRLIDEKLIGEIQWMTANFAFDSPGTSEGRHKNPNLGGGAMYDIGIYPLALALDLVGNVKPDKYKAIATWSERHIDMTMTFDMFFAGGFIAQCLCSFDREGSNDAIIMGSKGSLVMKDFWRCQKIEHISKEETYTYYLPFTETGFFHEIQEALECIQKGLLESPKMKISDTVLLADMMETLLRDARA